MRTVLATLSLMLLTSGETWAQPATAVPDLIIEEATIDPSAVEQIVVRVRNQGQRTIVSWGVRATLTDKHGAVLTSGGGTDAYEYNVRTIGNSSLLRPNDTHTIRFNPSRRGFQPVTVKASAEYAVFDDNSAVGDERSIEMVFERHARDAAAWRFIERTLADASMKASTPDGILFIARTEIIAAPRDISGNVPGMEVAQRIRVALRSVQESRLLLEALRDEVGPRGWNAAARSMRQQ
jgi:hypothetical protein